MNVESGDHIENQPPSEDLAQEQPQEEVGRPAVSPDTDTDLGGSNSRPRWFWPVLAISVPSSIAIGIWLFGLAYNDLWEGRALSARETASSLETELASVKTAAAAPGLIHTVVVTIEVEVTREVIITEYVEVTSTPEPSVSTEDERIIVAPNGLCTTTEPPCEYIIQLGDNKRAIAGASDFGDECRWPDIFDLNRTTDGRYPAIHLDHVILIPEVAERGTYASLINSDGVWTVIPDCSDTSGFPCMHTVDAGIYGNRYNEVSFSVFGNYAYTEIIEGANRESDCSSNGISLIPGLKIVIPKRVADNP